MCSTMESSFPMQFRFLLTANCASKPTAGEMLQSNRLSLASGGLTRRYAHSGSDNCNAAATRSGL
jgi:hypothetical protein